jgi:hypothetical protein
MFSNLNFHCAFCSKYKFMESHLVQQQKGLLVKIPDISNALDALHHLMKRPDDNPVSCHFELADSVFANAMLKKENTVLLWLGANVMLEYNYQEADELLTKNLKVRTDECNFSECWKLCSCFLSTHPGFHLLIVVLTVLSAFRTLR